MRQWFILVGLAALLAALVVGCGGTQGSDPGDDTTGNTTNDTPADTAPVTTGPDENGRYTAVLAMGQSEASARIGTREVNLPLQGYKIILTSSPGSWDSATRKLTGPVSITNDASSTKTMWHTEVRVSRLEATTPFPDFTFSVTLSWYDRENAEHVAADSMGPIAGYEFNDTAWNYVTTVGSVNVQSIAHGQTSDPVDWVFTVPAPAPTVSTITPSSGVNNGSMTITDLAGTGFLPRATVRLRKAGQADIVAIGVTAVSATKINGMLDLAGKATGVWDVTVTNADGQSGTMSGAFTIGLPPVLLGKWGSSGTGDGKFASPKGVAVDSGGNVYVADSGNHRIQKFTSAGVYITKWGSSGAGDGRFSLPHGVAVDSGGNVYVADSGNHRIQKFTSAGAYITKWGSFGTGNGQFKTPKGVAVDSGGNVYVADTNNYRIQKFTSAGVYITKWGSEGMGDGGLFLFPTGVAADSSGNVYVTDDGHRVQKFTSAGVYITKWGVWGDRDREFWYPRGIAVDSGGNVYVADGSNNRIQKFSATVTFLAKWGIYGTADGQFDGPYGIAVDSGGNTYVADGGNSRIQKFSP